MQWYVPLLSGIATGVGFLVPALWPLSLLGMVPLFVLRTREHQSLRAELFFGFLFGCSLYGLAFFALFWHALPLTWALDEPSNMQYVLVLSAWIFVVCAAAIPIALWLPIVRRLQTDTWKDVLIVPGTWVVAEWCSAVFLGFAVSGSGSLVGAHISIGFLGNLITDNFILLQGAWLGGVYALSFIVAASNVAGALLYLRREMISLRLLLVILFVVLAILIGGVSLGIRHVSPNSGTVHVAVLATQIPPYRELSRDDYEMQMNALTDLVASASDADLILLPESLGFLTEMRSEKYQRMMSVRGPLIVDSASDRETMFGLRRVEYFDTASNTYQYSYKRFFTPVGEYMPHAFTIIGHIIATDMVNSLSASRNFTGGPPSKPVSLNGTSLGAVSCNEALSPDLLNELAQNDAGILAIIASHGWYHGSYPVHVQLLRAARIRAVESHRPLIVANNIAPSFALDAFGRMRGQTAWGTSTILRLSVEPSHRTTPYTYMRPYLIGILFISLLSYAYVRRHGIS